MTLAATPTVNSFIGNGSANTYSFSFLVFNPADIIVTVVSPANVQTILTLATDYAIAGLNTAGGPPATGSIVLMNAGQAWLTAGNLTSGWTISIARIVSISQLTSIRNQGDFYPEVIENAFDYLTMICQQLQQQITAPVVPNPSLVVTNDVTFATAGAGDIFTTPDGTKTARLALDNNLNLIVQRLT